MADISTEKVRSNLHLPWHFRLAFWWRRRRMSPEVREIADKISEEVDRAFLFGDQKPTYIMLPEEEAYTFITRRAIEDLEADALRSVLLRIAGEYGVRVSPLDRQPWLGPTPEERKVWKHSTAEDDDPDE